MPTFTTPLLSPHPVHALPAPGTQFTDAALLHLLRSHLRPLEALAVALSTALEHEDLTYKVTGPLLDLLWESLYALVQLLDAWGDQQPVERLASDEGENARP